MHFAIINKISAICIWGIILEFKSYNEWFHLNRKTGLVMSDYSLLSSTIGYLKVYFAHKQVYVCDETKMNEYI